VKKKITPVQTILIGIGLLLLASIFQGSSYIARGLSFSLNVCGLISLVSGVITWIVNLIKGNN
jgi:hypothetical protein